MMSHGRGRLRSRSLGEEIPMGSTNDEEDGPELLPPNRPSYSTTTATTAAMRNTYTTASSVAGGGILRRQHVTPQAHVRRNYASPLVWGMKQQQQPLSVKAPVSSSSSGGGLALWPPSAWITPPGRRSAQAQQQQRLEEARVLRKQQLLQKQYLPHKKKSSLVGNTHKQDGTSPPSTEGLEHSPMLTRILLQLEHRLPHYCVRLSHPTTANVTSAAHHLDRLPHPPYNHHPHPNRAHRQEPVSPLRSPSLHGRSRSSPGKRGGSSLSRTPPTSLSGPPSRLSSHFLHSSSPSSVSSNTTTSSPGSAWSGLLASMSSWSPSSPSNGGGVSSSSPRSNSVLWMEDEANAESSEEMFVAEWESHVAPLLLLAAAEALYARMEHITTATTIAPPPPAIMTMDAMSSNHTIPSQHTNSGGGDHKNNKNVPPPKMSILDKLLWFSPDPYDEHQKQEEEAKKQSLSYSHDDEDDDGSRERGLTQLVAMYQKCKTGLVVVKEWLCDPILGGNDKEATTPATQPQAATDVRAATSLNASLEAFIKMIDARLSVLTLIHARLLGPLKDTKKRAPQQQPVVSWMDLSKQCGSVLKSLPKETGATGPIIANMKREIIATQSVLVASHSISRCSFLETVVHMKILKDHLNYSTSLPPLYLWHKRVFSNLLSIMPIVFDRIDAFSSPLHGFTKHLMELEGSSSRLDRETSASKEMRKADKKLAKKVEQRRIAMSEDHEAAIRDFMRKHESKGGPRVAVCVVLDAAGAQEYNFERGYSTRQSPIIESKEDQSEYNEDHWPAIFIRSSQQSGGSNNMSDVILGGSSSGMVSILHHARKRNMMGSRDRISTSESHGSSQRKSSSHGKSSSFSFVRPPSHKQRSTDSSINDSVHSLPDTRLNALEYSPSSGKANWPHTEWSTLVRIVTEHSSKEVKEHESEFGRAITSRPAGSSDKMLEANKHLPQHSEEATSLLDTVNFVKQMGHSLSDGMIDTSMETGSESPTPIQAQAIVPSVFHMVQISKFLHMVVIVEGGVDKWHNRRRSKGLPDEEIRSFLNIMASKLCVNNLFGYSEVVNARATARQTDLTGADRDMSMKHLSKNGTVDWQDASFQEFRLDNLRDVLGLRPSSPLIQPLPNSYGEHGPGQEQTRRNLRKARSINRGPNTTSTNIVSSDEKSALAFFMGDELYQCIQ